MWNYHYGITKSWWKVHEFTGGMKAYLYIVLYQCLVMWKSMRIKEETKKMLDELKVHPRQSYEEVVRNLVEKCGKQ